jgi:hypothetical protein
VLFSSLFNSQLSAGGLALGFVIGFSALGALPVIGSYTPGGLISWGNHILNNNQETEWLALIITFILIGLCLYLASNVLKNKEL